MNKAHKELLKKNYEKACNDYVDAMLVLFDIDRYDCWWIGNEVGSIFQIGDMLTLDMCEIVYVVENNISYDECIEWEDYNLLANEFNFNRINLKSWHMGAPRVPQETFDKLRKMKDELKNLCEETRNKF